MMSTLKALLILLVLFAFVPPISVLKVYASSQDVAVSAISQAEEVLASAYEVVLEAEQAGADVSDLLARLNVAGEYLASSHVWYELGDYTNATRFANLCYDVGEEVRNGAYALKNKAYGLWATGLVVRMTVSIVGVVVIVFLSFVGWRAFKRRYHKRVLRMKPEVVSGES